MTTEPHPTPTDWAAVTYTAFNHDRSVGVRCARGGTIAGIHLDPTALDRGDQWLTIEIPHVANIAFQKALHGMREEMIERAERDGREMPTGLMAEMELPTADDIEHLDAAELSRPRANQQGRR